MSVPAIKPVDPALQKDGVIDLTIFPPNLRKLGKYLLKKGLKNTLMETCEELGLNYGSVSSQIYTQKQKGNDFYKFLNDIRYSILDLAALDVDKALIKGAVSQSNADRKLYYQLKGELKDDPTNVTVNVLSVSAPISSSPVDLSRDKGVIDLDPLIPDTED